MITRVLVKLPVSLSAFEEIKREVIERGQPDRVSMDPHSREWRVNLDEVALVPRPAESPGEESIVDVYREEIRLLREALQPLVQIADAYDSSNLDEARPDWVKEGEDVAKTELFTGRGGKRLLTLADALRARVLVKGSANRG